MLLITEASVLVGTKQTSFFKNLEVPRQISNGYPSDSVAVPTAIALSQISSNEMRNLNIFLA